MAEPDALVEVLKEIRDELRVVRIELGARGTQTAAGGIRTELVDRRARWQNTALAAGALAGLALVLGLAMRERPAPQAAATTVAVAPQASPTQASAPVVPAAPVAAHAAAPAAAPAKAPAGAPTLAAKPATRLPAAAPAVPATMLASVPSPKKRVKPVVAAQPPAEVGSDEDATMEFPPPPRRARVHRLSYGPVGSEPAKL